MRIAFDIGGVLSKHPETFKELLQGFAYSFEVFVITDMHDRPAILELLDDNGFLNGLIEPENIYSADYTKHGEACKAVLLRELHIDIFFDDFVGYTCWPWPTPAPIRCLLMPDPYRPYWSTTWKTRDNFDFGRRVYLGE